MKYMRARINTNIEDAFKRKPRPNKKIIKIEGDRTWGINEMNEKRKMNI